MSNEKVVRKHWLGLGNLMGLSTSGSLGIFSCVSYSLPGLTAYPLEGGVLDVLFPIVFCIWPLIGVGVCWVCNRNQVLGSGCKGKYSRSFPPRKSQDGLERSRGQGGERSFIGADIRFRPIIPFKQNRKI